MTTAAPSPCRTSMASDRHTPAHTAAVGGEVGRFAHKVSAVETVLDELAAI